MASPLAERVMSALVYLSMFAVVTFYIVVPVIVPGIVEGGVPAVVPWIIWIGGGLFGVAVAWFLPEDRVEKKEGD